MYSIFGILFCVLEGMLVATYGWIALLWSPIGILVGLFVSANIFLPIVMGVPRAILHTSKNEMRPAVFLALFRAPFFWTAAIFLFAWFLPSAKEWVLNNEPLSVGVLFGTIAILFSPFSKKSRDDFSIDFDKSYGRYYTDQPDFNFGLIEEKDKEQINALITISSNLYLQDFSDSFDILNLQYPDSRFRGLIFCLAAVVKDCEDEILSPEIIQNGCLYFLSTFATSSGSANEYFGQEINYNQAEKFGRIYLEEFLEKWEEYFENIKDDNKQTASDTLCSMIHSIETDKPLEISDKLRLSQLCLRFEYTLSNETIKTAFSNLLSK